MEYTQSQWILFFFFYCFLGWVWESGYVSVKKREWINRGFLRGPVLPIYGFGAITILWLTLPVREHPALIFVIGLLGADILEYVTGAAMEKLFHMRYWDYSSEKFNLNGYICLSSTLLWGCFSVALTEAIHPPIERLILSIPAVIADPLSLAGVAVFAADVTSSFRSALNMREILEKIGENNEAVAALEARLDTAVSSFARTSEEFKDNIKTIRDAIRETRTSHQRKTKAYLVFLNEKANAAVREVQAQMAQAIPENEKARLSKLLSELEDMKARLSRTGWELAAWKNREYREAADIIRRNPSAVSRKFREAFEEIKALGSFKERREDGKE